MSALVRFYFHLDTTVMSDEELVNRWRDLEYCLKFEQTRLKGSDITL